MPPRRNPGSRRRYNTARKRIQSLYRPRKGYSKYQHKAISLRSHIFEETVATHSIPIDSTKVDANGNLIATDFRTFRFSDLPQAAHYADLFYQYRLLKIIATYSWTGEGTVVPSVNMAAPVGTSGTFNSYPINNISAPKIWVQRNHSVIAALSAAQMSTSSKTIRQTLKAGNTYSVAIVPSVYDSIQQNVNTVPTLVPVPKYKQWLLTNAAGIAVMQFGIHTQVQTYDTTTRINMGEISVIYKYIFECKGNE